MRGVFLMYHDVSDAADAVGTTSAGASRYRVSADAFRRHLGVVAASPANVTTVAEYARAHGDGGDSIVLTFDDGWAGSFATGVECLLENRLRATFFVTSGYVGTGGFAGPSLVCDAHAAGMEIGAHGVTHRFLAELPESEIRAELRDSKAFLEDLLGAPVVTGSVPGGAWSADVARIAAECGYAALCTSRPGINDARTDPRALRRVAIRRGTTGDAVERYAQFRIGGEVLRSGLLEVPRRLLGRRRYAAIRARLLGDERVEAAGGRI